MPISELKLSFRAQGVMKKAGINTVGRLCGTTEFALVRFHKCAKRPLEEIKGKLAAIGAGLAPSD